MFPNRKNVNNRDKCCLKNCKSRATTNLSLRFHRFPRPNTGFVIRESLSGILEKIDRFKAWQIASNIQEYNTSLKVCSLHFKKEDYILPDFPGSRIYLKKTAVPSLNLASNQVENIGLTSKKEESNSKLESHNKRRVETEMEIIQEKIKMEETELSTCSIKTNSRHEIKPEPYFEVENDIKIEENEIQIEPKCHIKMSNQYKIKPELNFEIKNEIGIEENEIPMLSTYYINQNEIESEQNFRYKNLIKMHEHEIIELISHPFELRNLDQVKLESNFEFENKIEENGMQNLLSCPVETSNENKIKSEPYFEIKNRIKMDENDIQMLITYPFDTISQNKIKSEPNCEIEDKMTIEKNDIQRLLSCRVETNNQNKIKSEPYFEIEDKIKIEENDIQMPPTSPIATSNQKKINSESNYETENAEEFGKDELKSNSSSQIFRRDNDLKDPVTTNEKTNHVITKYKCRFCKLYFASLNLLKKHRKVKHKNSNLLCPICVRSFTNLKQLIIHLELHSRNERIRSLNGKRFIFKSKLQKPKQQGVNKY